MAQAQALSVKEVVQAFNSRAASGRVVVNCKKRSLPLKLHEKQTIYFCCDRAYLTNEAYQTHKSSRELHNKKALNLLNIRMALNERDSGTFWRLRKAKSTKNYNEDGDEEEEEEGCEDNDVTGHEGHDGGGDDEPDASIQALAEAEYGQNNDEYEDVEEKPKLKKGGVVSKKKKKKGKLARVKGKKGMTILCDECKLDIPYTNRQRHMRTCHNPDHEYQCRYCSCRFEVPYGRMVHEVKCHKSSMTTTVATKVKRKLIKPLIQPHQIKSENSVPITYPQIDTKELIPQLSAEEASLYDKNIRKLGKFGKEGKARFQCLICQKTFLGSRNAQDHLNSHFNLKPYKCPLCDFHFSFRSNVQRHIKTCHVETSEFVCPYGCGCSMQSETSLKVHVSLICTLRNQFPNQINKFTKPITTLKALTPQQKLQQLRSPNLIARPGPASQFQRNATLPKPSTSSDWQTMQQPESSAKNALKIQFQNYEVSPGIYLCDKCNKTITGSGNFRDHLNTHLGIKPHKCPKCPFTFTFKSNIRRHLNSAHVLNGVPCPNNCGCSMSNASALQSHYNKCRIEVFKNKAEQAQFRPQGQISRQPIVPQFVQHKVMQTKFVPKTLPTPSHLRKILPRPPPLTPAPGQFKGHQPIRNVNNNANNFSNNGISISPQQSSPTSRTKYQCKVCGKSVSCRRNLNNHMLIHFNVKPCKCNICGLKFRTLDTLKKHTVKSHAPNSPYVCDKCPCRFSHANGLHMHKSMHHDNNSALFKQRQRVIQNNIIIEPVDDEYDESGQQQMDVDMNDMDMDDDEANDDNNMEDLNNEEQMESSGTEKAVSSSSLVDNLDIEKARVRDGWKCHLCGKVLKKPMHLRNHMYIHSGQKNFTCEFCNAKFRLASTLYDHKKSSHRNGPYKCNLCTCTFETNLGLSRHKGIFHNKQAHDYLQRRVRYIKEKAVKTTVMQHRPSNVQLIDKKVFGLNQQGSFLKNRLTQSNGSQKQVSKFATQLQPSKSNASPVGRFQCGHCGLVLASLNALSEHQIVHQNQSKSPPAASSTNASSPTVTNRNTTAIRADNINIADNPNPRACPICNQGLHGRKHFLRHMQGCHVKDGEFKCDLCPCAFSSQGNHSRHYTLMHPDAQKTISPNSTNNYVDSNNFVSVEMVDDDEEQLEQQPNYDDYGDNDGYEQQQEPQEDESIGWENQNATISQLQPLPHMMQNNKKIYKCGECGKMFDKMNRYKLHITIHSNVKNYKCTQCPQAFRLPGILATHVKKSHGDGNFRCQKCRCRFTSSKGLSVHDFVFHKGGRVERETGRIQQTLFQQQQQTNQSSSTKRISHPLPMKQKYSGGVTVSPVSISQSSSKIQKMMPPKAFKGGLKCHICSAVIFGSLKEHMRLHMIGQQKNHFSSNSNPRRVSNGQHYANYNESPSTSSSSNYAEFGIGDINYHHDDEDEEDEPFQIVGYENVNGEEENYNDGEYGEGQGAETEPTVQIEEYYEEEDDEQGENYDYVNADDHLEIVHEATSFNNNNNNDGDDGIEVSYEQDQDGQEWETFNEENQEGISCKGCKNVFENGQSFAYHVENDRGEANCPYCCISGITTESLPTHIEELHPLDEIEFLESQVYNS